VLGIKERGVTAYAVVDAIGFAVDVFACERAFCAFFATDVVLLGGEVLFFIMGH